MYLCTYYVLCIYYVLGTRTKQTWSTLDSQYILEEELIELADSLDWGKGDRLELVCLNLDLILSR